MIYLNDIYLVLVIFELMCILVDDEGFEWKKVWEMMCNIFFYICYILMLEVLEIWLVEMMVKILLCYL